MTTVLLIIVWAVGALLIMRKGVRDAFATLKEDEYEDEMDKICE